MGSQSGEGSQFGESQFWKGAQFAGEGGVPVWVGGRASLGQVPVWGGEEPV